MRATAILAIALTACATAPEPPPACEQPSGGRAFGFTIAAVAMSLVVPFSGLILLPIDIATAEPCAKPLDSQPDRG